MSVTSLPSSQILLQRSSPSATCASKLLECYFVYATCALYTQLVRNEPVTCVVRVVVTPRISASQYTENSLVMCRPYIAVNL